MLYLYNTKGGHVMNLERFYYKLPLILIICSFGTYISINLGLRVEHLVIYPIYFNIFINFNFKAKEVL